jgi:simple sugar transport system permease protein
MKSTNNKLSNFTAQVFPSVFSVICALLVGAGVLALSGFDPIESYKTLFSGAFGSRYSLSETLVKMIPILVISLGTSVAFKAQLWNIGGNGQYTIGAIVAVSVCVYSNLPTPLLLLVSFLASLAAGFLYGAFIGAMKAKLNANEVITTLMFDYIVGYFLSFLVYGPMMDPKGHGFPQSCLVSSEVLFTKLLKGTRLHSGLFLALALVVLLYLFWNTKEGFQIKLVGQNQKVARLCGVNVNLQIVLTLGISAAFAAVAGWIDVMGIHGRLQDNLSGSLGSVATVVALLGGLHPFGILLSSLLFSALVVGGASMQRFCSVPFSLVTIIQSLVIVFVISSTMFQKRAKEHE